MSRYDPLNAWLADHDGTAFSIAFVALESVMGSKLPYTARHHRQWWSNGTHGHPQAQAWAKAGWQVASVDMEAQKVRFEPDPRAASLMLSSPAHRAA